MFTILDTETTGLFDYRKRAHEEGQPRLASIAMVTVSPEGRLMSGGRLHCLVRPDDWSKQDHANLVHASQFNGLTFDQLVNEGKPIAWVLDQFEKIVAMGSGIAAYGVEFDTKVMRAELRRAGRNDGYGGKPVFCINNAAHSMTNVAPTDKMMAAGRKTNKKPNLKEAYEAICGQDLGDAHDALADLLATVDIFKVMLERGRVEWKEQRKAYA